MDEKDSKYILLDDKKHFHRKDEVYGSRKKPTKKESKKHKND
ncbi:MAG: hypothetical protein O6761_06840 [Thaumarchaeota archaeon]|nr:hypothetical protein [Nitrososphaerota archaeon]